ncbi:PaaI family thioesterase [Geodermatophilus sabuli]|uniref:PaaI family thioesterase n=1 Tax=Geodermatophilus sabuli TaxID=1564158 RepID=A0A7K3VZ60_9ACTN|nr:PaaI family thioesterase [Geodermatophilus sabuli]NEK57931.1 PaaI family thioesterase [Geodermatophilus sabuli]
MTAELTTESTPESWGEPRTRTVAWHDPMVTAAGALVRTGLETMEAIRDGILPPPPIAMLVQLGISSLEEGRVEFTCDVDESVYNPIGVVHGGLVCTVLDTVVGCAVHTTLPAGVGYTSIELKVNYLRAVHATSGPLTAVGTVVKPGRRVAFAEGEVRNAAGQTVATATGSLLVFPIPA